MIGHQVTPWLRPKTEAARIHVLSRICIEIFAHSPVAALAAGLLINEAALIRQLVFAWLGYK